MSAGISAGTAALVGGSLLVGAMGASASRSAASQQADAANNASAQQLQASREANALQSQMYNQNLVNQSPYMQSGQTALAALMGGMNLGAPQSLATNQPQGYPSNTMMSPGGGGLFGGVAGALAGAVPTSSSTGPSSTIGDTSGTTNYGASNSAMANASNQYAGQLSGTFKPSDLNIDPSYQWRLNQGTQALNSSAAARGLMGSGQNLKDITDYAQGAASQEYGNAFNRYNTNQTNLFNRLSSLAGVGQTATNQVGSAGSAAAGAMGSNTMSGAAASGNYLTSGAAAGAAGQVGSSNAWGNAINGAGGNYMGMQYLNNMNGGTPGYVSNPTDMSGFRNNAQTWSGSATGAAPYIP